MGRVRAGHASGTARENLHLVEGGKLVTQARSDGAVRERGGGDAGGLGGDLANPGGVEAHGPTACKPSAEQQFADSL
jgi:hypothetical protein